MSDPDELLTPEEVAQRLRLHRHTVYRWIKSKRLRARNEAPPGKRPIYRIRVGDLEPDSRCTRCGFLD